MTGLHTNIGELSQHFDAFLVDQFGVLVGGDGAYPFAVRALAQLASSGKPIVLLTNSGKRSAQNEERLSSYGFSRDSYQCVLSSGEAAYLELGRRIGDTINAGEKVFVISRDDDLSGIEGLELTRTHSVDDADLILLSGSMGDILSLEDYCKMLEPAAKRAVPCLCTNPDIVMMTPSGRSFGAGRIAQLYQNLGGPIEMFGKPHSLIYQLALAMLGNIDPARVLCIGDSPAHDIAGGNKAGFATALVRTGLHAQCSVEWLIEHCTSIGALPDYIIPGFQLEGH